MRPSYLKQKVPRLNEANTIPSHSCIQKRAHPAAEEFLSTSMAEPFKEPPSLPNLSSPSNKEYIDVLAWEHYMMPSSDPNLFIRAPNIKPWRDLS